MFKLAASLLGGRFRTSGYITCKVLGGAAGLLAMHSVHRHQRGLHDIFGGACFPLDWGRCREVALAGTFIVGGISAGWRVRSPHSLGRSGVSATRAPCLCQRQTIHFFGWFQLFYVLESYRASETGCTVYCGLLATCLVALYCAVLASMHHDIKLVSRRLEQTSSRIHPVFLA